MYIGTNLYPIQLVQLSMFVCWIAIKLIHKKHKIDAVLMREYNMSAHACTILMHYNVVYDVRDDIPLHSQVMNKVTQ